MYNPFSISGKWKSKNVVSFSLIISTYEFLRFQLFYLDVYFLLVVFYINLGITKYSSIIFSIL